MQKVRCYDKNHANCLLIKKFKSFQLTFYKASISPFPYGTMHYSLLIVFRLSRRFYFFQTFTHIKRFTFFFLYISSYGTFFILFKKFYTLFGLLKILCHIKKYCLFHVRSPLLLESLLISFYFNY